MSPLFRRTTVMWEQQWTWVEYKLVLYKPLSIVNFVRAAERKLLMWRSNRSNATNTEKKKSHWGKAIKFGQYELIIWQTRAFKLHFRQENFWYIYIYIILFLITLQSCSKHMGYTVTYGTRGLLKLITYLETILHECEWSNYNRLHDWNLYCWCVGWMFCKRLLFHDTELYGKAYRN